MFLILTVGPEVAAGMGGGGAPGGGGGDGTSGLHAVSSSSGESVYDRWGQRLRTRKKQLCLKEGETITLTAFPPTAAGFFALLGAEGVPRMVLTLDGWGSDNGSGSNSPASSSVVTGSCVNWCESTHSSDACVGKRRELLEPLLNMSRNISVSGAAKRAVPIWKGVFYGFSLNQKR